MTDELKHDWSERPRHRRRGTLSIRPPKPDKPANDETTDEAGRD